MIYLVISALGLFVLSGIAVSWLKFKRKPNKMEENPWNYDEKEGL